VDASLLLMAFAIAVAIFVRSDAPFLKHHFAAEVAAAKPLPPSSVLESLPRGDARIVASIDVISEGGTQTTVAGRSATHFSASRDDAVDLDGWAIDNAAHRPAAGVVALIDGQSVGMVHPGRQRPDVAAAFADRNLSASGFHLEIPAAVLPLGRHRLSFLLVNVRRDASRLVDLKIDLDVHRKGPS
jgi:hypothetical protein